MATKASIDFCESNFTRSTSIAEIHNTWSSLTFIALPPLIGMLYSNPTKEMRFYVMYFILLVVGCGSIALHATLEAFPQSLDEVPMLHMNCAFFFSLLERGECVSMI
jgi:hypothetical protein